MSKKRVLIDAGHGGADPGAQASGIDEKDITLAVALETGEALERRTNDVHVFYMRVQDKTISLTGRYKSIMELEPDAFVSVHCNAVLNNPETPWDERKHTSGLEIFYRDSYDLPLAQTVHNLLRRSGLWPRDRGIKQDQEWLEKRLSVLNSLETPCILIELGFLTNDEERRMILNNIRDIADLIARGIQDFLFTPGGPNGREG